MDCRKSRNKSTFPTIHMHTHTHTSWPKEANKCSSTLKQTSHKPHAHAHIPMPHGNNSVLLNPTWINNYNQTLLCIRRLNAGSVMPHAMQLGSAMETQRSGNVRRERRAIWQIVWSVLWPSYSQCHTIWHKPNRWFIAKLRSPQFARRRHCTQSTVEWMGHQLRDHSYINKYWPSRKYAYFITPTIAIIAIAIIQIAELRERRANGSRGAAQIASNSIDLDQDIIISMRMGQF